MMNPRIALEVLRDRLPTDILELHTRQGLSIEFEFPVIGGKNQSPVRCQEFGAFFYQHGMIPLNIPGLPHSLGCGEGGRVQENQIEAPLLSQYLIDPFETICLYELVAAAMKAIQLEITLRPLQIGAGQIHGGGRGRPALGRVHRSGSGVGEEIEKTFARRSISDHPPGNAMVEE